tara:strand:- start:3964 stop:4233 length:270 start_codon:yes stop_codon:yes gene_type:complete
LVLPGEHDHSFRWAAIQSVASKIGCTHETLRSWVKNIKIDTGVQPGITTNQSQRTKELKREMRKLKCTIEILRKGAAFFAQADLDRKPK